ncbi:soyasapogenol B glucuronide galactosyltransferase [Trifolium repens]|nr:soyasapogenol B glucuronide galactosyltransferase [Trifolium repens]
MDTKSNPLHIIFFPFMGHGHMIPTIDMAKIFASKGVKATIVTTPLNKPMISNAIAQSKNHSSYNIDIQTIKFPCVEGGLPEGCENVNAIPSPPLVPTFFNATKLLQKPFEELLLQQKPHCIIADMFFPWATDSAAKFGIPRIVFHGTSFFSLCAGQCMKQYEPHKNVSSDTELFEIPNLPVEKAVKRVMEGKEAEEMRNKVKLLAQMAKKAVEEGGSSSSQLNAFIEELSLFCNHQCISQE